MIHVISEPLQGKIKIRHEYGEHTNHEYLYVDTFDRNDVKSAVEFYKRYSDGVYSSEGYELLKKEKPDIHKEFTDYILMYRLCACIYNYWLYEYCFKDVIE